MTLSPCPKCRRSYLGTDVSYTLGTAIVCCDCKAEGPRAHIEPDVEHWHPHAEKRAQGLWNAWAESHAEQLDPLGQVIHN